MTILCVLFLSKVQEAKERLKPALSPGNVDQTMSAPVTAIIAYDMEFYEYLRVFSRILMLKLVCWQNRLHFSTAFRNGSLQGAYFMLACRALGLDLGAMSGFDNDLVDNEFLARTLLINQIGLCNIGYGDPSNLHPRDRALNFPNCQNTLNKRCLALSFHITR